MQVGSRVQTTGCVRCLLSGPVVYTGQRFGVLEAPFQFGVLESVFQFKVFERRSYYY